MADVVKYEYAANVYRWPIPFAFTSQGQVRARLAAPSGIETDLAYGRDYLIDQGAVVRLLEPGYSLIIFKDAGQTAELAVAVPAAALQTAAAVQPAATTPVPAAAQADASELSRKLDLILQNQTASQTAQAAAASQPQTAAAAEQRLAAVESQLENLLAQQAAAEAGAGQTAIGAIEEAGARAEKSISQKLDIEIDALTLAADEAQRQLNQNTALALAASVKAEAAGAQAEAAGNAANDASDAAIARLEAKAASLENSLAAQADSVESRAAAAAASADRTIAQASLKAQAEAAQASRLAGQAWPQTGWHVQTESLPAKSIVALPSPLSYWPGRNSLCVARNGFVLALGHDFEEVGTGAALSNTIRLLAKTDAGDIFSWLVLPTNAAQEASRYAARAEEAAFNAEAASASANTQLAAVNEAAGKSVTANAQALANVNRAAAQAQTGIDASLKNALAGIADKAGKARADCLNVWQTADADIRKLSRTELDALRDVWAKAQAGVAAIREEAQARAEAAMAASETAARASGNSAAASHSLAECAWRAAFQASLDRAMPGVATARSFADLAGRASGIYIINPACKDPLPFMGLFPVAGMADVQGHDGVFLVGAEPYPDAPPLPDIPYPDEPAEVPEMHPQAEGQWLPCGHHHSEQLEQFDFEILQSQSQSARSGA